MTRTQKRTILNADKNARAYYSGWWCFHYSTCERTCQDRMEGRNGKRQSFVHDCLSLCDLVCCMKGIRCYASCPAVRVPTAGGRILAGNDGISYNPLDDGHDPPLAYPTVCKRLFGRPRIGDMSLEMSFSIAHTPFPYPGFFTGLSILSYFIPYCQCIGGENVGFAKGYQVSTD